MLFGGESTLEVPPDAFIERKFQNSSNLVYKKKKEKKKRIYYERSLGGFFLSLSSTSYNTSSFYLLSSFFFRNDDDDDDLSHIENVLHHRSLSAFSTCHLLLHLAPLVPFLKIFSLFFSPNEKKKAILVKNKSSPLNICPL